MEFDESKQGDRKYLIQYYQSVIDRWNGKPNSKKIIQHFKKVIKQLEAGKVI